MHKGLKIVGGSLLAAWLALNPGHALAQESKDAPTSISQFGNNSAVHEYCGAKGFCTGDEARAASARQIVLHHGTGVEMQVEDELRLLHKEGYPAIALPGGPNGLVKMFVAELSPKNLYTGGDLDRGKFTHVAEKIYDAKVKPLLAGNDQIVPQLIPAR